MYVCKQNVVNFISRAFFLLKHWKCLANIACIAAGLVTHRFRLSATQAMHTRLKCWFMSKVKWVQVKINGVGVSRQVSSPFWVQVKQATRKCKRKEERRNGPLTLESPFTCCRCLSSRDTLKMESLLTG